MLSGNALIKQLLEYTQSVKHVCDFCDHKMEEHMHVMGNNMKWPSPLLMP